MLGLMKKPWKSLRIGTPQAQGQGCWYQVLGMPKCYSLRNKRRRKYIIFDSRAKPIQMWRRKMICNDLVHNQGSRPHTCLDNHLHHPNIYLFCGSLNSFPKLDLDIIVKLVKLYNRSSKATLIPLLEGFRNETKGCSQYWDLEPSLTR
jgi:hypothetical protein